MKATSAEKPRTSNVTIKLESSDKERLQSLAAAKERTPHYLMKEAIQQYLEQEEAEQRFIALAQTSLDEYRRTGEHITLDELSQWVQDLQQNPQAALPVCHK